MLDPHDVLSDVKLNINRRKTKKTQIFLYDTGRRLDDYMMKLRHRNNEQYEDIPHYIIKKKPLLELSIHLKLMKL